MNIKHGDLTGCDMMDSMVKRRVEDALTFKVTP